MYQQYLKQNPPANQQLDRPSDMRLQLGKELEALRLNLIRNNQSTKEVQYVMTQLW